MSFNRAREIDRLERYAFEHKLTVDQIEAELRAKGVPDDRLDELVLTAAENIDSALADECSAWASEHINNQGFAAQIAFILQENGSADGLKLIEQVRDEAMQPSV